MEAMKRNCVLKSQQHLTLYRYGKIFTFLLCLHLLTGCATTATWNPSFPVSASEARVDLQRMEQNPRRLERPLLILCGWMDPGFAGLDLKKKFKRWTGDNRIHAVSFNITASMEECRKRVIQEAEKCFPSSESGGIREVDIIGVSMGGLVARYAAISPANATGQNTLRIHRLFTISTPHQGAIRSNLPPLNQQMREMRKGSAFLKNLDAESACALYSLIPYVRLGDLIVGAENAAPPGLHPWWVSCLPLTPAHSMAFQDPRILADIARRLRGEPSYTHEPAAPLPE